METALQYGNFLYCCSTHRLSASDLWKSESEHCRREVFRCDCVLRIDFVYSFINNAAVRRLDVGLCVIESEIIKKKASRFSRRARVPSLALLRVRQCEGEYLPYIAVGFTTCHNDAVCNVPRPP